MFRVIKINKISILRLLLISGLLVGLAFTASPPQNVQAAACSRYYMVQPGDDLYRIAALFWVDWMSIASVNGVTSPYALRIGQTLCIPTQYSWINTYSTIYPSTYVVPAGAYTTYPYNYYNYNYYYYPYRCTRYHVVQWGENLYRIGLLYGVSWTTLARLNNINDPNAVYVGQTICIAADSYPYSYVPPTYCRVTHTVQPGQTLYQIASMYGTTWTNLAWANNLPNPNTIYAGQTLCIVP